MNLKAIIREEIRPILEDVEEAFKAFSIDYYLIGAMARDIWFARGEKQFRATKDIDFAILVDTEKHYQQVRGYLEEKKSYHPSSTNDFVMLSPDGTPIDLLPFGSIEFDDGVQLKGTGLTNIKVNGFMEVYEAGTEQVEVINGHNFQVATLAAIILLKLIAYDDRPEQRIKDAGDIGNILMNYFELETPLIYDFHSDLFTKGQPERELEEVASIVAGREIKRQLSGNPQLFKRTCEIINGILAKHEKSDFTQQMTRETNTTINQMMNLLQCLLKGLEEMRKI